MSKLLLIASLFTVACVANTDSDDVNQATQSEIGPVKTDGASCTLNLPAGWSTGIHNCRSGGTGTRTIPDGNDFELESVGPGAGSCTIHCANGVKQLVNCTCS